MEKPKIKVALPAELLERLKAQADRETRTVNNLVADIVAKALPAREATQ
jgi:predicted DNA-binding protein